MVSFLKDRLWTRAIYLARFQNTVNFSSSRILRILWKWQRWTCHYSYSLLFFPLFHIMIHDSFWRIIQSFQEWRRTKFVKKEKDEHAVTFWLTCNHCPTNRNILKNYPIVPGVTKAKILWKWQRRMCHHILVNVITNSSWKSSVIR